MPIPVNTLEAVSYVIRSPKWGDLSDQSIVVPAIEHIPYVQRVPKWLGSVVVNTPYVPALCNEPSSQPYVQVAELNPLPGATGVGILSSIVIPCGDRIAATEDVSAVLVDSVFGSVPTPPVFGLDPLATVITVVINGVPTIVFMNGTPQSGWVVSVADNDYSGTNRNVPGAGKTYSLVSPIGFPSYTTVSVSVLLIDYGGNEYTYSYTFTTVLVTPPYPRLPDEEVDIKTKQLSAIDLPFRFLVDCDVVLTYDEAALRNNVLSSVMLFRRNVPLRSNLGSAVPVLQFDPNDEAASYIVNAEIFDSIRLNETRVKVLKANSQVDSADGNSREYTVEYEILNRNDSRKSILLSLPKYRLDG